MTTEMTRPPWALPSPQHVIARALGLSLTITIAAWASPQDRACAGENTAALGPYVGQVPPGSTPSLFAPGFVSTGMVERDVAMTPDGRERAGVVVAKGSGRKPVQRAGDVGAGRLSHLDRHRRHLRQRRALLLDVRRVADDEDLRMGR